MHDDRGTGMNVGGISRAAFAAGVYAALICWTLPAQGADQAWDQLVAAARTEGKVVVVGPPDADVRRELPKAFKKRFDIDLEYIGGRGRSSAARIATERAAGHYTADAVIAGLSTLAIVYYREKMLDPLKPALVLPEVLNGSKWKRGGLWFVDPEKNYVLRISNNVQRSFYINTAKVKADEIRSIKDLVDPKWRGKIAMDDPTLSGSGLTLAARVYISQGKDFVKKLFVDQKPRISRDRRQLADWLVRGTYPIVFNAGDDDVAEARKQGFPVKEVDDVIGLPLTTSAGFGMIGLLNRAPHPSAAKVFVNWIASREGMEIYSRARAEVPTRNDIDEASYLAPEAIPKPGIEYFDTYDWDFVVTKRAQIRRIMKKMMTKK